MHKILRTEDGLDSGTWFLPAGASGHGTRTAADDANVKVKSGKLELTPEEKLFHCAGIRAVEFNPLSHQAWKVSQGIQERVQESQGQDGCRLGAHQDGVQDNESDAHTRNLMLFKRF